jgi:hypothetical protein
MLPDPANVLPPYSDNRYPVGLAILRCQPSK